MLGVLALKFNKYVIVFFYYAQWYKRLNHTQGTIFVLLKLQLNHESDESRRIHLFTINIERNVGCQFA